LAALLLWQPAAAKADEFIRTLSVRSGETLEIALERGDVELIEVVGTQLRIEASARGVGADGIGFEFGDDGNGWRLASKTEVWVDWLRVGPRISVRAWIPNGVRVAVETKGRIATSGSGVTLSYPVRPIDVAGSPTATASTH
jgi:hypothetical protein